MNKVLITVFVPMLEEKYDMFIPINKKIGTVKKHIIDNLLELSKYSEINTSNIRVYDKDSNICYDENLYVKESGIINGSRLVLM